MRKLTLLLFILAFGSSVFAQSPKCNASEPEVVAMRRQFNTLDPTTKVNIWREHLQNQLKGRPLDAKQRKVITDALNLYNEELYIQDTDPNFLQSELGKKYLQLQKDMRSYFSLRDGAEIFERIDPEVFKKHATPPGQAKKDGGVIIYSAPSDCTCSTTWTWCENAECSTTCTLCKACTQVINCGPFWGFTCDGRCSNF